MARGSKAPGWAVALSVAAVTMLVSTSASAAVWGSFDATRINYETGCLTCTNNALLVTSIEANGDTVAMPTEALTEEYLDLIDVFYTSMLAENTGELSAAEQTALMAWVAEGGTLIITAEFVVGTDIADAYSSFSSSYGVDNFIMGGAALETSTGTPIAKHPIVDGVTTYEWNNEAIFDVGKDALVLGYNESKANFMAVLEPDTGFCVGGRIFVMGDHNIFNDPVIVLSDNQILADNLIDWAAADASECPGEGTTGTGGSDTGNMTGDTGDTGDTTGGDSGTTGGDSGSTTSGGDDTTTGGPVDPTTGGAEGLDDSTGSPTPTDDGGAPSPMPTDTGDDGTSGGETSGSSSGGCRVHSAPFRAWWALALLPLGWRRRRSLR